MKIIVDDNIPYIKGVLESLACVEYLSPAQITADRVKDVDALFVRTRTRCDASLLEGSRCRFIATATIGYDHIDRTYCEENGIFWTNAPGCNATSVAQYVTASLLHVVGGEAAKLCGAVVGIVGVGHVGGEVMKQCRSLGMTVLQNDPPRALKEGNDDFVSLEEIARCCDYITFHTPLTLCGEDKTYHLANEVFFSSLRRSPYVLNAARGEIFDTTALLDALESGQVSGAIVDCWEGEPNLSLSLLERVQVGTPHIAGYSADGKSNATKAVIQSFAHFLGREIDVLAITLPPPSFPEIDISSIRPKYQIAAAVHATYGPDADTLSLRNAPSAFEPLRGNYPFRREFPAYALRGVHPDNVDVLLALGFTLL